MSSKEGPRVVGIRTSANDHLRRLGELQSVIVSKVVQS
jgi:hypothetical protein